MSSVSAQPFYEDAGWAHHGELTYTAFGWSMSNAGDVNGDGFDDMIVTAIDYSNPEETNGEEGKIYVYYGSADGLSDTPDFEYETNNDSSVLGFSSDGGDLNGDGFSDIVVGCLQWSNGEYNEGSIFLWYGSAAGLNPAGPDWTLEFNQVFALLGSGVAMSGDINSDGYNDLLFSAKMWDGPETDEGKTWLYWGSPDGPVESGWSWESNQAFAISGFPVNYAGDVNADGYDDVIIGANQYDYDDIDDGYAVAFYGSATGLNTSPDWEASSGQRKSNFGHWVDGAGDVNGDGYDDVIVAALLYESDSTEYNEGRVFVYLGGPDGLETEADWFGEVNQLSAQFGYSCAGAGDINGDGYDDVIGGAKYWNNGEDEEGGAFVWFGSAEGLKYDYCWEGEGNQAFGYYGRHVGGNADYNHDGYSDFMVGAYRYSDSLEADGKAFVYYGAPLEAQFHYPADTFCIEAGNQLPVIDGLAGGYFYSENAIVDSLTGELNIAASGGGYKTIFYHSSGLCPVDSFKLFIEDTVGAEDVFYYPENNYCEAAEDPLPEIITPGTGYFYSADAIVDSLSGMIDISATGYGGPYIIYYFETTTSGCDVLSTDTIFIDYDASFYYEKDTFCILLPDPLPITDDLTTGTFYSDDCSLNNSTGKLHLDLTGIGGPYTIYYQSDNSCDPDSFIVWIVDIDSTADDFYYADTLFCIDELNPVPVISGLTGGEFSSDAEIDPVTGEINLTASGEGEFTVFYSVTDAGGCALSQSFEILIDEVDANFNYGSAYYYQDETDPVPSIAETGGTFTSAPEGILFSDTTGTINLDSSAAGNYMIYYFLQDSFCSNIDSVAIEILPPCASPQIILIDSLTPSTVVISWEGDDYYTSWFVYLVSAIDSVLFIVEDDTSIEFTGLIPGENYSVYVFTDCIYDTSYNAAKTEFTMPVNIHQTEFSNQILVFPNPAGSLLTIQMTGLIAEARISIIDEAGRNCFENQYYFSGTQNRAILNVNNFSNGIYLIRIISDSYSASVSVVIDH